MIWPSSVQGRQPKEGQINGQKVGLINRRKRNKLQFKQHGGFCSQILSNDLFNKLDFFVIGIVQGSVKESWKMCE